jgi:hypothetical protein
MMFQTWFKRWRHSHNSASRRGRRNFTKQARRSVPVVEVLEERTLLSFAAPVAFDLGAAPNAVAVGHFEGGKAPLDVVTANGNGTLSVLLGKVDGTLQNPILLTVGGSPDAVAVGDFVGNRVQDIVVANGNGTVSVLLSNGNNTFKAPETLSLSAIPTGVAVGDFNGDGKLDIGTANSDGSVSVLLGKGNGTFGAPITSAAGGSLTSVAVGDFNRDGKPDLVVGTKTGLDILLGNGNGSFQLKQQVTIEREIHGFTFVAPVSAVAVTDLRGDGKPDVVASADGQLSILLGNGDGTVQQPFTPLGGYDASFVVGDFNGDGKPDIATSNLPQLSAGPSISVLTGEGDGTFNAAQTTSVGEAANALAAGDFRGNGKLDLVLASNLGSNTVTVLPGNGNATFAVAPTVPVGVLPSDLTTGDFNGDGKPDLAAVGPGGVAILLGNGDGTFRSGPTLGMNGNPTTIVVGDFNGDGKQDIAVSTGDTVSVFLGNGNGTFQAAKTSNLGNASDTIVSMVAGVFGPGSQLDLAVTAFLPNATETSLVTVLLNNGNGTFVKGQSVQVGVNALGLATADFNGDGHPDLVTTSLLPDGTRNVEVLLGKGDGIFGAPIITRPGGIGRTVATGDFNGDGKTDVVLVDNTDNEVIVLLGNGDGTFGQVHTFQFDNPTKEAEGVAVGDFFGDGKLSIAVATGVGDVSVLRGNGDGTFQAPIHYLGDFHGQQPVALVAADFNGDGKADVAAANFPTRDISVLLNTSPAPAHGKVATTTTLTADISSAVFGQPVTLTATVTAAQGTPTGTVTFFDGSTTLGAVALDPNGQARLVVQLTPGTHTLRASFAGIAPFQASSAAAVSETVNKAHTTTTLTARAFAFGEVELMATVTPVAPGAGSVQGTVAFFEGSKFLASAALSGGQTTVFLRSAFEPGEHTVIAVYDGNADFNTSTSKPVTFTVSSSGASQPRTSANSAAATHDGRIGSLTMLHASSNTAMSGVPLTLTAGVAPQTGTAGGTVTFFDGSTLLGQVALGFDGRASLVVKLTEGKHRLKAVFSGNGDLTPSSSPVLMETVIA